MSVARTVPPLFSNESVAGVLIVSPRDTANLAACVQQCMERQVQVLIMSITSQVFWQEDAPRGKVPPCELWKYI